MNRPIPTYQRAKFHESSRPPIDKYFAKGNFHERRLVCESRERTHLCYGILKLESRERIMTVKLRSNHQCFPRAPTFLAIYGISNITGEKLWQLQSWKVCLILRYAFYA